MSLQKEPLFNDLLFIPHVRGDTDCWWLVREVFSRYGITIPNYNSARVAVEKENYDKGYVGCVFEKLAVDLPEWGLIGEVEGVEIPSMILMSIDLPVYHHVGVRIGINQFIHCSSLRGKVTIERLDNPIYAKRKYYRYID